MKLKTTARIFFLVALAAVFPLTLAASQPDVGKSPWGPDDQIGRLNLMTDA